MVYYRLYILTEKAHIESVEAFEAPDDETAVRLADRLASARKELWCDRRRVKQWMLGNE